MSVEPGQLRVWDDTISRDKTPFLVIRQVEDPNDPSCTYYWKILWLGKVAIWSEQRMEVFSEVIDTAGATAG